MDINTLLNAGATNFRSVVSAEDLPGVLEAYSTSVTSAFILSIAVGGLATISTLLLEWKSVKGKNLMAGAGA